MNRRLKFLIIDAAEGFCKAFVEGLTEPWMLLFHPIKYFKKIVKEIREAWRGSND